VQRNLHCFFRSEGRLIAGTIRFFDLFSGIGGFREGLHRAGGFTCVGHCEADAYADHNYRVLFDTEGEWFCNDARNIETERMPDFDLLCAGFPCQAFSIAGRREGFADARGTLFFEVARLVADKRPAYFLLENVPGLLSHDKGRTFHTILSTLSELGYHVEWKVLNSKDFGVPQSRKRVYIVGYLDGRCAGKILPFPKANGTALIQVHAGKQGERVYAEEGLSCTLTSGAGGMGGKTGLYEVGIPIKENTRKGYKMAYEGDSIDLGYPGISRTEYYQNLSQLSEALENGMGYDLVLMDIEWEGNEQDGIAYAAQYNARSPQTRFIFVTAYNDKFSEKIFWEKVNLCGFLVKPVRKEHLEKLLDKVREKIFSSEALILQHGGITEKIANSQIRYIESNAHQLLIHTISGEVALYEKTIPARFKRISNHHAVQPQIRDPQQDTHYIAYHSIALI